MLDLSLRNRFLNFRETRAAIPILSATPELVEDELSAERELALLPRPALADEADPLSAALSPEARKAELDTLLRNALAKNRRIHTALDAPAHQLRLTELYRAARLSLEENGANTLFAAVGVLEWRETENSERILRAPLLLVPVELRRKSILEGFSLRRLDEETRVNVTLLEMLRQHFQKEIPGLDPLPGDESGVDVPRVFEIFRDALRAFPHWEFKPEIWLAQFSFTKFLLWKDLTDRMDALLKNRVVAQLVGVSVEPPAPGAPPEQPATPAPTPILAAQLDDNFSPAATFCPRSADSSQLAAVMAAAAGHDFVLEGPPGTGKSQTITNIIAHCLAEGKRILFVAEKRAALDVVHRRLREDGLDPFCLELHSNKSGKTEVLAQFKEALDATAAADIPGWERATRELQTARDALNAYVRALHRPNLCGLSAHDCLDSLLPRPGDPVLRLKHGAWANPLALTGEFLDQARELVAALQERAHPLAPLPGHPLSPLACEDYSPLLSEKIADLGQQLAAATRKLLAAWHAALAALDHPDSPETLPPENADLENLRALACTLAEAPPVGADFYTREWKGLSAHLDALTALAKERDSLRQTLTRLAFDETKLRTLGPAALASRWQSTQSEWFLPRALHAWQFRRSLRVARAATPETPNTADTALALDSILRLEEIRDILGADTAARDTLGALWNSAEPDATALANATAWGAALHAQMDALAAAAPEWRPRLAAAIGHAPATPLLTSYLLVLTSYHAALADFAAPACLRDESRAAFATAPAVTLAFAERLPAAWPRFREWCSWQKTRTAALRHDLAPFVEKIEKLGGATPSIPELFERSFRRILLLATLENDPVLRTFIGREHEAIIERFRQLDDKVEKLTRAIIRARLAARAAEAQPLSPLAPGIPAPVPKAELTLLNKEIAKKMRHIPVRQLLARIPTLLPRLKPCVMMSPLSVAQYLDPDHPAFDIVIFDEASQIPVWDAIGAIARGTQVIVVGDPKQLPPTNFFNTADTGDDENDDASDTPAVDRDLESILDELLAAGLPRTRLQWHYRSRHEGLITFSNRLYYDNDLLTFPSPETAIGGIRFHHLPAARYDKGGSRTNREEATALVAALVARLRETPGEAPRSFGVVTFSLAQQRLIENMLDDARRQYPEIEPHFGATPPVEGEPLFVKNLENVQGDERDVIFFSIGYGLYADGLLPDGSARIRVSTNFGPLNREGGERRLNVAITRAKHEIHVFSGIQGGQMDITRTRARGVHDLRDFLRYAESGGNGGGVGSGGGAGAGEKQATGEASGAFLPYLATRIRAAGFLVEEEVGTSTYRVALAIADPAFPSRYILGVEWDGPHYRSALTARDRDKLRSSVLAGLGWRLHRIWAPDYWADPDGEFMRLLAAIAAARL
jgi:hypothetical protein